MPKVKRNGQAVVGLSRHRGKKVPDDLEALSGLSLKKAMICWSQSSTIAEEGKSAAAA